MATELKRKRLLRSTVWEYFVPNSERTTASCKLCVPKNELKTPTGCTSSLSRHLQTVHGINSKHNVGINESQLPSLMGTSKDTTAGTSTETSAIKVNRTSRIIRPKLVHLDKIYLFEKEVKGVKYFHCKDKPSCLGRLIVKDDDTVEIKRPHSCVVSTFERAKHAAIDRLRELTLSVEGSVKAIELVRKVLKDVPPEVRAHMPTEDSLIHRVRRWAKSNNIQLVKATPEDFLIPEGEEPLIGFQGIAASGNEKISQNGEIGKVETKTGVICTEPGSNKNDLRKKHERLRRVTRKTLKRVDEDGNEIGLASLHEFISGDISGEWEEGTDDVDQGKENCTSVDNSTLHMPTESTSHQDFDDTDDDDNDFVDHGDDFQTSFEPEKIPKPALQPIIQSSFIVSTSSIPPARQASAKQLRKGAAKSGERCFVCGDELIVSETLGSSEDTFRTACRYFNVRSNGEWFPRTKNAKFYSFCESCTTEVHRIHSLYRKIEEIQSLIFKKVESVEKRIADAEIVDNWMAEAPHSTAVRFEGFRNQVMINYRNKLKLRREIRFGRKTGQPFVEVQPTSSVHMFAKDPFESSTFLAAVPDDGITEHSETAPESVTPARRTRGRPKSKKPVHEQETVIPAATSEELDDDTNNINDNDDDGCFDHDFDDSQDAMSETSEKEVKFWVDDPGKLEVKRQQRNKTKRNQSADKDYDLQEEEAEDEDNDPDYEEDDDDADEDWGTPKKKKAKSFKGVKNKDINSVKSGWRLQTLKVPDGPRSIIFEDKKKVLRPAPRASNKKTIKTCQSHNIKFPDAVLTKDGRVFMEGIEIIKNPPGAYKLRPYSISFTCGTCGKITRGFWSIRFHICGHHLSMFKCHICQKEFTDPRFVERHIAVTHQEPTFNNCPICEKPVRFSSEKSMLRHRWRHLGEEEKLDPQYKTWCPPAQKPGRIKNSTRDEVQEKQTYMCGHCAKTFYIPSALKKHELTHDPNYECSLMCQYCGNTFSRRSGLTQHVLNCARKAQGHVNLIKYPCPKCSIRFSTRGARSKHVRKFHSDVLHVELPFTCPKCPRSFSTRSGFKTHKRVCIDGEKGNNVKRGLDPKPSISSESLYSSFKTDATDISSTVTENNAQSNNPQYDSAVALGFNYNFMGGGNNCL